LSWGNKNGKTALMRRVRSICTLMCLSQTKQKLSEQLCALIQVDQAGPITPILYR
jgi:hypothetical protein